MKKVLISLAVIMGIIFSLYIYVVPYQKYNASKNFDLYIKEQGVDINNIESKKMVLSTENNGYVIYVRYKDDEEFYYKYIYISNSDEPYHIFLEIFEERDIVEDFSKVKYKPLDWKERS